MNHAKKVRSKARKNPAAPAAPAGKVGLLLPANCTIREIGVLHDCLRTAPPDSQLDGSAVVRIDTAGLQLLVAFMRERRTDNQQVQWQSASSAINDAAGLVGAMSALNLPTVP